MILRRIALCALLVSGTASAARAQLVPPAEALAAEGAERWDDAMRLYESAVATDSRRVDLWIRMADIEAHRGDLTACIAVLQRAAAAVPGEASVYFRLSQAYSMAGRPAAAFEAIEGALILKPADIEYLRARATLATWIGEYAQAGDSYRRLAALVPADVDITLAFARVSAWSGDTNEAVHQYERYLKVRPDAGDVWLELAQAESWRGNYSGAMRALDSFRERFGARPDYSRALAAVMASAGRPGKAEDMLSPLLAQAPNDFGLNLTRTIALAMQHRARDAFSSLDRVRQLSPGSRETRSAERIVRTALASTAGPQFTAYADSDQLQLQRFAPRATLALIGGTQVSAGYERTWLDAPAGSGLEQLDGGRSAEYRHAWVGGAQKIGGLTLRAQAGYATADARELSTYELGAAARFADRLTLSVARSSGAVVISPRTVGMGLTDVTHRLQIDWAPTLQSAIGFDGAYQQLSDGNRRLEITLSPRRSFVRRAGFNLDLGVSAYRLETERDLSNGYYDPRRYEQYGMTAYPYFKITENTGLSLSTVVGAQRDSSSPSFHLGGTIGGEATFGIYQPWVLKVNGSASMNRRLESGAFRGFSGGIALVRRF
jgi:tetratricopeptide (TPR) repeat protein